MQSNFNLYNYPDTIWKNPYISISVLALMRFLTSDLPNQKWAVIINNPSLLNKSSQGHHQYEMHQTWEMPKCQEKKTNKHKSMNQGDNSSSGEISPNAKVQVSQALAEEASQSDSLYEPRFLWNCSSKNFSSHDFFTPHTNSY